jgi:hypothetical protein
MMIGGIIYQNQQKLKSITIIKYDTNTIKL